MAIRKWDVGQIEQLGLGLVLDAEREGDAETGRETLMEVTLRKEAARRGFELRVKNDAEMGKWGDAETEIKWGEEYLMLREAGWPWEAAVYVAWAASPKLERWPRTLDELAKTCLGLTGPRRIHEWRKKNPAIDETVAMLQAAPLLQHRRDIYEALIASATTNDYKGFNDRKLALELLGDYVPQSKLRLVRAEPTSEQEMSDAELRALLGGVSEQSTVNGERETGDGEQFEEEGEEPEW